jgi:outer membrane protein assembly factor BamA
MAAQSTPPERSSTERGLSWYDNQYVLAKLSAGWDGFHMAGTSFPAGAGLKFGLGFDRPLTAPDADPTLPNRVDLSTRIGYSTRGYTGFSGRLDFRNIAGAPVDVAVHGQYYEYPQEDFFGIGRDSLESNRSNYLLDNVEGGVSVLWRPLKLWEFGGGASYVSPRVGRGTDSRYPSTGDLFDPATIPGFAAQPDFLKADVSAAFDWRDNPLHPHDGGRYEVTVSQFDDRELHSYDFRRVDVRLQQYVPLPHRYRVLALRGEGIFTDASGDQQVPFYFQPTLGGATSLRGYREFRFRDQNSLLLGAEYRWEAWWALDVALFADAGTVAPTRRDLSVSDMDVTYGFGFRFHSNRAFVGRLDFAFSKEGFIPLLRWEHVF